MTDAWKPPSSGALDDTVWPDQLIGRAVATDPVDDRLYGYGLVNDIARHYAFSDLVYLGIVGELPNREASHVFHVALCAAAPVSVAEASSHAAVLARLSGSTFASALATGLLIAADRARFIVAEHAALLAWLAQPTATPPVEFCGDADTAWVANVTAVSGVALAPTLRRSAALLALFHAAGVAKPEQLEAAIVAAQVASISAEALQTGPQHLAQYPVKTPPYRYVEGLDSTADETDVRRK
jgi:hypothetical protein